MILTQHGMNSILRKKGPSYGSVVIGDKTYRTVIIGNQEWIVENLDWAWTGLDVGSEGTSSDTPKANYYDNDETTYGWDGRKCGLLYNWQALHYLDENSDTMLPDGWRVPTKGDWTSLTNEVGGSSTAGTKLKAANVSWASSWGGTDDYGFSVLPGGYYDNNSENYYYSGTGAFCWMSTIDNVDNNEYVYFQRFSTNASSLIVTANQSNKYSVRLVRDYPPPVTIGSRSYKTVKMPDGKVWLAENLDWKFDGLTFRDGTAGNEMDSSLEPRAAYYNYDESTYGAEGNKYGLLYNWGAADYINDHGLELGLPEGWHVASPEEWQELFDSIGEDAGKKLKSTTGWRLPEENGTDEYGFGAVPAGKWSYGGASYENPAFVDLTADGYLWTSYREEGGYASSVDFYCNSDDAYSSIDYPAMARSLRLVYTPPTKLDLPDRTIRIKMVDSTVDPAECGFNGTWTRVEGTDDTWDCYYNVAYWYNLLGSASNTNRDKILACLGANAKTVISFEKLFNSCHNLKYVSYIDTSNIRNMSSMFSDTKIKTIPKFNTKNVTNMYGMFSYCRELVEIPMLDTSNVTDMADMFLAATSIKYIPCLDTKNVTTMNRMFGYCSSLRIIPKLNTEKVTDMNNICIECKSLTEFYLDTSNVVSMDGAFYKCTALTVLPALKTDNLDDADGMFIKCVNVQSGALSLYQQMSTQSNPPTSHFACFENCGSDTTTGAAELAQIPSDWK